MMKFVVFLALVGISAASIVSKQSAVIPHYSHHGHGHGMSSRYFEKVEAPGHLGYNGHAGYLGAYGYGAGLGAYGYGPAGLGLGYGAGLGLGYGAGLGLGYGLGGYGWAIPGAVTSVTL